MPQTSNQTAYLVCILFAVCVIIYHARVHCFLQCVRCGRQFQMLFLHKPKQMGNRGFDIIWLTKPFWKSKYAENHSFSKVLFHFWMIFAILKHLYISHRILWTAGSNHFFVHAARRLSGWANLELIFCSKIPTPFALPECYNGLHNPGMSQIAHFIFCSK